jgi:ribonuclease E
MFQRLGIEAEVERLAGRKVSLPSGANFVIDQAEALVAIDVNSAKSKGEAPGNVRDGKGRSKGKRRGGHGDLEDTVFAVNMEAAQEIARQLRLRDLGGIIVVDFIDMEEDRHRRKVEEAMRRALAEDKAKIKVYDISPLGLMQISRQRLRKAGPNFTRTACEACQGRGWHASAASGALAVLRRLEDRMSGRQGRSLTVTVPFPVANHLLNDFRSHVLDLEKRYGAAVRILADSSHAGEAVFAAEPGQGGQPAHAAHGGQGGQAQQTGQGAAQPSRRDAAQGGAGEKQGDRNRGRDRDQGRDRERRRGGRDRGDGRRRDHDRAEEEAGRESVAPSEARDGLLEAAVADVHGEGREAIPAESGAPEEAIAFAEAVSFPDGEEYGSREEAPSAPAPFEEPLERLDVQVAESEAAPEPVGVAVAEVGSEPEQGRTAGERPGRRGRGRRGRGGRGAQDATQGQGRQEGRRPPQKEAAGRGAAVDARVGNAQAKDGGRKGRGPAGRGPHGRGPQGEGARRGSQEEAPKRGAQAGAPQAPQPQAKAPQGGNRPAEAPVRGRGDRKAGPREAKQAAQGAGTKGGGKSKRGSRPQPAPAALGAAPKSPRKGPIEY